MKRRLFAKIFALTTILCCAIGFTACSQNENDLQGMFYQKSPEGPFSVCYGYYHSDAEPVKDVVILPTYKTYPVLMINSYAFKDTHIETVKIPENVQVIDKSAFENCANLTTVNMGKDVRRIDEAAFQRCTNLTDIDISNVYMIRQNAFAECSKLKTVKLSDNIEFLGDGAFYDCISLENVDLGKGLTTLTGFDGCISLAEITIPESVTVINPKAFAYCEALTEIGIPDSVTDIGAYAFQYSGIKNITLPESMTTLQTCVFGLCEQLETINLPNSITKIWNSAFSQSYNLKTIIYDGTMAQWKGINKNSEWHNGTGDFIIQCTDGNLNKSGKEISV